MDKSAGSKESGPDHRIGRIMRVAIRGQGLLRDAIQSSFDTISAQFAPPADTSMSDAASQSMRVDEKSAADQGPDRYGEHVIGSPDSGDQWHPLLNDLKSLAPEAKAERARLLLEASDEYWAKLPNEIRDPIQRDDSKAVGWTSIPNEPLVSDIINLSADDFEIYKKAVLLAEAWWTLQPSNDLTAGR